MKEAGFSKKVWVASADACPFCLDAQSRFKDGFPIEQPFFPEGEVQEVPFGKNEDGTPHMIKLPQNYGNVIGPPLHPHCRCTVIFEE